MYMKENRTLNLNRVWAGTRCLAIMGAVLFGGASLAWGQEATPAASVHSVGMSIWLFWAIAPAGAIIALIFAWRFYQGMLRSDEGDADMIRISGYVRQGALAYLKQQYKIVAVFFVVVSVLLFYMGWVMHVQHQIVFLAF